MSNQIVECVKCSNKALLVDDSFVRNDAVIRTMRWNGNSLTITFICKDCDEEQEVRLEASTPSVATPGKGFALSRRGS